MPPDTQEVHLREENTSATTAVFLTVKTLKAVKSASCGAWNLKCLTLNTCVHLTYSCASSGLVFGRAPNDWQIMVTIPICKKRDSKECTNYRITSLLSLSGKLHVNCLEKKNQQDIEANLRIPRAVFVLAVALQNKRPLSSKYSRSLESMSKMSTFVWSIYRKHTTRPLKTSFGELCESAVYKAAS